MDLEKWNEYHQNQTEKDVSQVLKLFDEVLKMIVLYYGLQTIKEGLFSFALYPVLNNKVKNLFEKFNNVFSQKMNFYIDKHYNISKNKFKDVFTDIQHSPKGVVALQSLVMKEKKRMMSDRVWNLTKQYRTELEMALDVAIHEGTPANQLTSVLKKYLQNPDTLFRKYRDKNGVLQLSKKAKEYRSGQGVYRSAYKNAERLARTEINIAYRTADIERWQAMDIVAGYEIKRSKHPYGCEICEMMKGIYPKNFVWVGNHPNCRCYMTPVFKKDTAGKEIYINPKLTEWIAQNEDKIATTKSMPMFLWGIDRQNEGVSQRVIQAIQPFSRSTYVAFDPFSPVIIERLKKIKHNADKQKLLQEIIDDERAKLVFQHETNGSKTVLFDLHRGKGESLNNTLAMAKALNEKGKSVALLPEYDKISSADAITLFKKKYRIADFKHSAKDNHNTIAEELIKGYKQADLIVLKMEKGNLNTFKKLVEQVYRNSDGMKDLILINKYNKVIEISKKDFLQKKHLRMLNRYF